MYLVNLSYYYQWSIKNIDTLIEFMLNQKVINSPSFPNFLSNSEYQWQLCFYPSLNNYSNYLKLSLICKPLILGCKNEFINVKVKIYLKAVQTFSRTSKLLRFLPFSQSTIDLIPLSMLEKAKSVLPSTSSDFTLSCKITVMKNVEVNTHELKSISSLDLSFKNNKYFNVVIVVQEKRLYAHKEILIKHSDVITAMFKHKTVESRCNLINVSDLDYVAIFELLRFMYTRLVRHFNNKDDFVIELLIAADYYNIADLTSLCEDYLKDIVNTNNAVELFIIACRYNAPKLKEYIFCFICSHAIEIISKKKR